MILFKHKFQILSCTTWTYIIFPTSYWDKCSSIQASLMGTEWAGMRPTPKMIVVTSTSNWINTRMPPPWSERIHLERPNRFTALSDELRANHLIGFSGLDSFFYRTKRENWLLIHHLWTLFYGFLCPHESKSEELLQCPRPPPLATGS